MPVADARVQEHLAVRAAEEAAEEGQAVQLLPLVRSSSAANSTTKKRPVTLSSAMSTLTLASSPSVFSHGSRM